MEGERHGMNTTPPKSTGQVILQTVSWILFFCFSVAALLDWIPMTFGKAVILAVFFVIAASSSVSGIGKANQK